MRQNNISSGTVYYNNPKGTCNFCDKQIKTLLPSGFRLTVVSPENAVAPDKHWQQI